MRVITYFSDRGRLSGPSRPALGHSRGFHGTATLAASEGAPQFGSAAIPADVDTVRVVNSGLPGDLASTVATAPSRSNPYDSLANNDLHMGGWEEWLSYAKLLECLENEVSELQLDLAKLIVEENFSLAAEVSSKIKNIKTQDEVATAVADLDSALRKEEYDLAALLRDQAALGMLGWWAGHGDEDAFGHLLYISTHFGRIVAEAFTAKDLARLVGWSNDDLAVPMKAHLEKEREKTGYLGGQPLFELLLRRCPDTGKLLQQVAALRIDSSCTADSSLIFENLADALTDDFEDTGFIGKVDDRTIEIAASQSLDHFLDKIDYQDQQVVTTTSVPIPFQRVPAWLEWEGRNVFTLNVDSDSSLLKDLNVKQVLTASGHSSLSPANGPDDLKDIEGSGSAFSPEKWTKVLKDVVGSAIEQTMTDGFGQIVGHQSSVSYRRLTQTFVQTDPLTGIFVGAFGPHGPEILQVSRLTKDGVEWVEGVKLTGDVNVPAGQVSFRAKVGRGERLPVYDAYPHDLGVVARYRGEGRVAREGFANPKWVDGELLQLSPNNPLTRGSDLGFVFAMDGLRRFLILFGRCNLSELRQM